jgi:lipoprotein-anchoring transpeptidase ErfK/SrfK
MEHALPAKRRITGIVVTCLALVLVALAGYVVVQTRHDEKGSLEPMAVLASPSPTPSAHGSTVAAPQTSWLVAEAKRATAVYRRPSAEAPLRVRLPRINAHGCVTVMLVRSIRTVGGATWYDVWLPLRRNFSSGWVKAGDVGVYPTAAEIVVDLSARRLTVYRHGKPMDHFTVAVGSAQYPTPTGSFFVAEKTTPPPGGPYGVLALGLSGYQPLLPTRGALAIHGTDNDAVLGQAVSEGCIRMRNADVVKVSRWVPAGSPVLIAP